MRWFGVHLEWLLDPGYLALPTGVRATHMVLLGLAAKEERGGIIAGCRRWLTRQWSIAGGLSVGAVEAVVGQGLAKWLEEPADALLVRHYDLDGETALRIRVEKARKAAKSMHSRSAQAEPEPSPSDARAGHEPLLSSADPITFDSIRSEGEGNGSPASRPSSVTSDDRQVSDDHLAAARRIWARQESLRVELTPACSTLQADDAALQRVVARLVEHDEAACVAVLESLAADAREDASKARWIDGTSNWTPSQFSTALGRAGATRRRPPLARAATNADKFEDQEVDWRVPERRRGAQ